MHLHTHTHTHKPPPLPQHSHQGCQSSAFRGNFAFFFFYFPLFWKWFSVFFEKSHKKKKKNRLPTPPLSAVRSALVNSRWRLGLPVCASSVSGWRSKVTYPLCIWNLMLAAILGVQRALPQRGGGEGDGLSNSIICTPSFSTLITLHTHTLSLSLSLTHTHTHTDIQGWQLLRFRHSMLLSVLYLRQKCYGHSNKIDPIFFSHPDLIAPLPPPLPLSLSKQNSAAKSQSSTALD